MKKNWKNVKANLFIAWGLFWFFAFFASLSEGKYDGHSDLAIVFILAFIPLVIGLYIKISQRRLRRQDEEELIEKQLLRIAQQSGGRISIAQAAQQSELSLDEAKVKLDAMVSKGFADYELEDSGVIFYRFFA